MVESRFLLAAVKLGLDLVKPKKAKDILSKFCDATQMNVKCKWEVSNGFLIEETLLPFLDYIDLVHFYQLNKRCKNILDPSNKKSSVVEWKSLWEKQGRDWTDEEI